MSIRESSSCLQILGRICDTLQGGERVDPEHLARIHEFLKVFADTCHHAKEEELLFPAMVASGIPKEGGPIAVMLAEHTVGREHVRAFGDAVSRYANGDTAAAKDIVDHARAYIALLTQHIEKEDKVLYPLADRILPQSTQEKLLRISMSSRKSRLATGNTRSSMNC